MSAATRDTILTTAARLFHEQGYSATGIATICREAGVKSGSLYHFFPSKDALLLGVLRWYEEMLRPFVMDPIETQEADPIRRVFALLDWYRGNLEVTGCRLGCPIGNLALELSDTHPHIRPAIDANFRGWAKSIRQWLDEAGDRLAPSTDRDVLSRFVLTVMEGGLMQARASDSLAPFDEAIAQLRLYFDSLLNPKPLPPSAQGEPKC